MPKHDQLLLGAHMSIAGGFEQSLERGQSIGCTVIQIFTKGNRQWKAKPITDEQAQIFAQHLKKSEIKEVVAHAMYLLNMASPDRKIWHGTISAVAEELNRCAALGIKYLIIHPGAHLKEPLKQGLDRASEAINRALEIADNKTSLLLENMAGQGSSICSNFEELATVIAAVEDKKRVGVCIDTCHAFAAGYDFGDENSYKKFWKQFDDIVGKKYLKAMHINDSKKELNSHVDRHEEIGKGKIPLKGFELIMNDPHLFNIPKILETPYKDLSHYKKNLDTLISLIKPETKKKLDL